jgi:hypothetical protein
MYNFLAQFWPIFFFFFLKKKKSEAITFYMNGPFLFSIYLRKNDHLKKKKMINISWGWRSLKMFSIEQLTYVSMWKVFIEEI